MSDVYAGAMQSTVTFGERLEMMILAYIVKHGHKPLLVSGSEVTPTTCWGGAFLDAAQQDPQGLHPKLAALAEHGARAWRAWTKLEPDEVVLIFEDERGGESKVSIAPRTQDDERRVALAALRELRAKENMS